MKLHRIGLSFALLGIMGIIVSYLDPRADIVLPALIAAIGFGLYSAF